MERKIDLDDVFLDLDQLRFGTTVSRGFDDHVQTDGYRLLSITIHQ